MATQQYNVLPGAYHAHSLCVGGRTGGKGGSFTDSRAIWIVLINLPTFYQELSFNSFLLSVGTPSVAPYFLTLQHFYLQENAIYSLIMRNPTSGKVVFLFNRIIAKRIVLHCLLNTQAEIMTWTQQNTARFIPVTLLWLRCYWCSTVFQFNNISCFVYTEEEREIG